MDDHLDNTQAAFELRDETMDIAPVEPTRMNVDETTADEMVFGDSPIAHSSTLTSASQYAHAANKGGQRVRACLLLPSMGVVRTRTCARRNSPLHTQHTQRRYIFVLDSLGSRHPQAQTILRVHVKLEAVDKVMKLHIEEECSDALGLEAHVSINLLST
ncbi:hypothetical protein FIBSPDRAFT_969370 [Athelia psychrophila]|uniref:Uncharacterized protein n=1 Tax=Athelia psychrophila TaxID=1759441 RepID=A0A167TKX3_9AGAM|nr:hypothetical protein FIBSPDRAFT_969370 [Fibularhizoctonia sp. CBS 109695]